MHRNVIRVSWKRVTYDILVRTGCTEKGCDADEENIDMVDPVLSEILVWYEIRFLL